jgi:hypothetical protein
MREAKEISAELSDVEASQEGIKSDAEVQKTEATAAVQALMTWRNKGVLPRAKIALDGDTRLRHFRPGKMRSVRSATVIREGRLLVDAIKRFADDPKMLKRGLTLKMAEQGEALIKTAIKEDTEAAVAHNVQLDVTDRVYELEDRLDDILAEVETCAAAVFEPESAALKRYRLNEIRNYIAQMHGQSKPADPTAEVQVPDAAPEQG